MSETDSSLPPEENENNQSYTPRKPSKLEEFAVFAAGVAVYFGFIRLIFVMKN